uniref:HAT C-terminal dimerisation domain-containing protein n=1 Tax=Trichuris muris TaxID=70415 RepID=A0A5S6Q1R9_TRIMR
MSSVLCDIEAMVNARPLPFVGDDPKDMTPLTPSHFLIGRQSMELPAHAGDRDILLEASGEILNDVKSRQMEVNIFSIPFNVEALDMLDNLQHEIIQLQTDDELKARYNLPLLDFYKRYRSKDDFPALRRYALKYASLFGTTYFCEQLFSKCTIANSHLHCRLTDANLVNLLRVAKSSVPTVPLQVTPHEASTVSV